MGKIIVLLIIGSMGCKLVLGRWPWEMLALSGSKDGTRSKTGRGVGTAQARTLLGVSTTATRTEIIEAHKRLLVQVHPDRGGSEALVYEANDARDLLLERIPSSRA
jgi:DnaJ family protein C protein 19